MSKQKIEMDGLSLLGMVCENEKQKLSENSSMTLESHFDNTLEEFLKVKSEEFTDNICKDILSNNQTSSTMITIKEEQMHEDNCESEDLEIMKHYKHTSKETGKSSRVISSHLTDEENNDSDDLQIMKCFDPKNKSYEKSSQAVATHLNVNDFGHFIFKIQENQFCKFSEFTGWHLQRATGMMKIKVTFRSLKLTGPLIIRAVLVRKDVTYRDFGVDRICENHRKEVSLDTKDYVLQAAPGLEGMWSFGSNGPRKSICFDIGSADPNGFLEETIGLKCICNDSCSTCDDPSFKQTESSRDLLLVLTLESKEYGIILARRSIIIWPKAVVRPKDLYKTERRKPKGGAAKLNKMKEMLVQKPSTTFQMNTNQTLSHTLREANFFYAKVNKNNLQKSQTEENKPLQKQVSEKKFNILLHVKSKNGIPTTNEVLDSTIGFAVKNAQQLGLSKSELLKMVESFYDDAFQKKLQS